MPARAPSDWPAAQAEFRTTYGADRTTLPRLPVWWRVVRRVRDRGYRYKGEGVVDRLGVVDLARHPVIAIWPANASRGEPASLVFDAEDNAWASRTSEGSGDLIGEAAREVIGMRGAALPADHVFHAGLPSLPDDARHTADVPSFSLLTVGRERP